MNRRHEEHTLRRAWSVQLHASHPGNVQRKDVRYKCIYGRVHLEEKDIHSEWNEKKECVW